MPQEERFVLPFNFHEAPISVEIFAVLVTAFLCGLGIYLKFLLPTIAHSASAYTHEGIYELIINFLGKHMFRMDALIALLTEKLPIDSIPTLPIEFVLHVLGWLGPIIVAHDSIFVLLTSMVNFLESIGSPLFDSLNNIYEEMREDGNNVLEIYRELEKRAGISISDSRIPLQDWED